MARNRPRHVVETKHNSRFLGVAALVLIAATGSVTMYECSPDDSIPLLPSSASVQDQPAQIPSDPSQTPPSDPAPTTTPSQTPERNNLASMRTTSLQVGNRIIQAWIAEDDLQRQYGLMWVQPHEMADNQGMLFVFPDSHMGGFWMKDTLISLDIAFIRDDGMVVGIDQMAPRSLALHGPSVPYQYALEVHAGILEQAGLQPGLIIDIPSDVLNP